MNDIYEYITKFTDEKTTLSMLSVNKKFYEEKILLRVMNKKYPLLYKIKKNKKYRFMSWRQFYVKMLRYISKIFIEQGVSYISHKKFDPCHLYYLSLSFINLFYIKIMDYSIENNRMDIVNTALKRGEIHTSTIIYSTYSGKIENIQFILNKYNEFYKEFCSLELNEFHYNCIMCAAALKGYKDIVDIMLERGANDYNEAMISASKGGNFEIVNLMVKKGANDFNSSMSSAAFKGNIEIVKFMLLKGANDYYDALCSAAARGHAEIVKLMIEKYGEKKNYNRALFYSIKKNHFKVFKLIVNDCNLEEKIYYVKGITEKWSYNYIYYAAKVGNIDMVKILLEKGNNYPDILYYAIKRGNIEMFNFLIDRNLKIDIDFLKIVKTAAKSGYMNIFLFLFYKYETYILNNLDEIIYFASIGGNFNIVDFLIQKGAKNFEKCFLIAAEKNYFEIIKLLSDKIFNYENAILIAEKKHNMEIANYLKYIF